MPLDSNGVWQYEETETATPFSTLLNKLASSVSTQVGLLRAAVAPVVGTITPTSGTWKLGTSPTGVGGPYVVLRGQAAVLGGAVRRDGTSPTGVTSALIGMLPAGSRPGTLIVAMVWTTGGPAQLTIDPSGALTVDWATGQTLTADTYHVYLGGIAYEVSP